MMFHGAFSGFHKFQQHFLEGWRHSPRHITSPMIVNASHQITLDPVNLQEIGKYQIKISRKALVLYHEPPMDLLIFHRFPWIPGSPASPESCCLLPRATPLAAPFGGTCPPQACCPATVHLPRQHPPYRATVSWMVGKSARKYPEIKRFVIMFSIKILKHGTESRFSQSCMTEFDGLLRSQSYTFQETLWAKQLI